MCAFISRVHALCVYVVSLLLLAVVKRLTVSLCDVYMYAQPTDAHVIHAHKKYVPLEVGKLSVVLKRTLVQASTLTKLANVCAIVVSEHAVGENSLRDLQASGFRLLVCVCVCVCMRSKYDDSDSES